MSFTSFASDRSCDPSSFAQLLKRKQRVEKRPQSSLQRSRVQTERVTRDGDTPSSQPYTMDTSINAPQTTSPGLHAGLLTPPYSHPSKRRGSTSSGLETPAKRPQLQSNYIPLKCSLCGSEAEIEQCQSCVTVYLCSYCKLHAPLAHPFPGHSFRLVSHDASVDMTTETEIQDLDRGNGEEDVTYEDAECPIYEPSHSTDLVATAAFPCRFCGKAMEGSWFKCQDCVGADAYVCFHHAWLHDRLHPSHTTKSKGAGDKQDGDQQDRDKQA